MYEDLKIHSRMQKEFIDVAAHELRTPIQPILGLTEILRSKTREDDDEQNKLLDAVIRNAKRLQRLADDILDVTKIESQSLKLSNKQYFNLNDIIINVLAYYQKEENDNKKRKIKLLYYHNYENIYVEADKPRITQVISNLLRNALKFTNDGEICVNVGKDDIAKLILVSIRDTGAGIDPEILPRLFTKFATKSFEGTGLGLYISKSIVEAHGGRIWAENNSNGNGASFSFTLPLSTI